jgi:metal-sulfur cluster biosynthetic enzyme
VELGLIYNIQVEEGIATITYSLTSPGCPIGPAIEEQLIQAARTVSGIEQVSATLTFNPSWTPDDMSEDAKFALGY